MINSDLLTPEQNEVLSKLVDAWGLWIKLPRLHDDGNAEFRSSMHRLQYMVMIRPVQRDYIEQLNKEKDD